MILNSFQVSACWPKWNWWTTCWSPKGLNLGRKTGSVQEKQTIQSWEFSFNKVCKNLSIYRYDVSEFTCSVQWWFTGFCGDLMVLSSRSRYPWSWVELFRIFPRDSIFLKSACWRDAHNQSTASGRNHMQAWKAFYSCSFSTILHKQNTEPHVTVICSSWDSSLSK